MPEVLPVPMSVVDDMRRARRHQRLVAIHWIDALYQVYIAGIGVVAAVAVLSTLVGDGRLSPDSVANVRADAPGVLGIAVALALYVGLRSGSRGGPLAVEAADVRHVLMAPVDRGGALRSPALRQLRFVIFVSLGVGAAAGQFAGRRFPTGGFEWVLCGALCASTIAGLGYGAALMASSRRLRPWMATLLGGALLLWAVIDVLEPTAPTSPTSFVGRIALWPLHFDPVTLVAPLLAVALVVLGLTGISGLSLEAAERRTALVGQLRFAVTLQDLRTVMVLRRQLAADLPRSRPWIPAIRGAGKARFPVWQRGWRGVLRWPLPRLVRLLAVAVIAGFVVRGLWSGTTPLLVAAGLLLWVAALDAVEPLSQETDHPGRRDAYPVDEGSLMVRHLAVPTLVMVVVAAVVAGVASAAEGSTVATEALFISVIPMALAATAGAVVSVLMGAPKGPDTFAISAPEIAGMKTVLRTIWPPALAFAGLLPVLFARNAADKGLDAVGPALRASVAVLALFIMVCGWVYSRADLRAWWAQASEAAMNPASTKTNDDDDDD